MEIRKHYNYQISQEIIIIFINLVAISEKHSQKNLIRLENFPENLINRAKIWIWEIWRRKKNRIKCMIRKKGKKFDSSMFHSILFRIRRVWERKRERESLPFSDIANADLIRLEAVRSDFIDFICTILFLFFYGKKRDFSILFFNSMRWGVQQLF